MRVVLSRAAIVSGLSMLVLMNASSAQTSVAAGNFPAAAKSALDVARFTADGQLVKPADLAQWVFLGASLGMGYNQPTADPTGPGQFQVVLMEPTAYRYFMEHGTYAQFYPTLQDRIPHEALERALKDHDIR